MIQSLVNRTPFVEFCLETKAGLTSSPASLLSPSWKTRLLDSLMVTNTSAYRIQIDAQLIRPDLTQASASFYLRRHFLLEPFEQRDLLTESCLYLTAGDRLRAYSGGIQHTFDVFISYRTLLETSPSLQEVPITSLIQEPKTWEARVTLDSTSAHTPVTTGDIVQVIDAQPEAYNGYYMVTVPEAAASPPYDFSYQLPAKVTSPAAQPGKVLLLKKV